MTVGTTTTYQIYNGGGTTFAVPFTFTANSQVKVYEIDDSATPPTVTLQTEGGGSDYTIVGTNVVFNSATAATSRIYVGRNTPRLQEFDPLSTAQLDKDALETQLDKVVKMVQELEEKINRAFVNQIGANSIGEIPSIEGQAGKFLTPNSDEDGLEWVSELSVEVTNSASTDNRLLKSDGTAGNIQQTGITVDDSNNVSGASIDADSNTITNIDNADIKAGANIAHSKMAALTASRAMVTDGSGVASASSVTATELGYLSGVTSGVQSQINGIAGRLIGYQVFTASGSYDKTVNNPSFVIVEGVGGGGGSGGIPSSSASECSNSGAGGGGGYFRKKINNADLSNTTTVTVGTGGAGGASGSNAGSAGGTTSFGAHASATGGSGGDAGLSGTGAATVEGGDGGTASSGDINISGQKGQSGRRIVTTGVGGHTGVVSGGNSMLGLGGALGSGLAGARQGSGYGAGASGLLLTNASNTAGADGTDGIIIVWEFS